MNRIYISLRDIPTTRLQLGFEGENDHTQVIFDGTLLYARYPSAVASMTVKSPSGGLYPKTLVQSGNKLVWNITASDCAKFGSGQYQLTFTSGTEVIKTYIGNFSVNASLLGSGDPPDPVEDWLQEAQEALDAFEQDVSDAESWAVGTRDGEPVGSTDPAYHNNSKYYAEQAGEIEQTIEETGSAQVEAIEAKGEEVLESIPSDYTALSEDVDELYAIKAPAIECSASGSIASFTDGADGMPLRSLSVAIEPVQDLHGQDSPYPAGGGKNLLDLSERSTGVANGITYTVNKNAEGAVTSIVANGTASAISYFGIGSFTFPAGTYVLSGCPAGGGSTQYRIYDDASWNDYGRGATRTFAEETTVSLYLRVNNGVTVNNLVFKPMVCLSSATDPTVFAPYSNICPISGWTGAKVTRTGKNLAPVNTFATSHDTVMTFAPNLPAGVYTYSYKATRTGTDSRNGAIRFVYDDDTYIQEYIVVDGARKIRRTFTLEKPLASIYIYSISGSYSDSGSFVLTATDFQLELGSTAYKPYSGETAEYEFPQSAGTVYGGTLTIHQDGSGELVVDRATFTEDGSSNINASNTNRFYINRNDARVIDPSNQTTDVSVICDRLKSTAWAGLATFDVSCAPVYGKGVAFRNDEITTAQGWKDYFTQNPTQFSYALATPVTYQLTNQQVIETLKGNNVMWADTGDVSVSYPADTKLYIDGKIAEIQALILENISNS